MCPNSEIAPPAWVRDDAEVVRGLDLLALRAPAMRIGNALLDGITTVTPIVRYLGVLCWITKIYWERRGADSKKDYLQFARSVEAAIVLGNLLVDPSATGLVGSDDASEIISGAGKLDLEIKIKAIATTIYAGAAEQLGLLDYSPTAAVPRLTATRGMKLANQVHRSAHRTALGHLFCESKIPSLASWEDLKELGTALELHKLPDGERDVLIDILMPTEPIDQSERSRMASYATLLALAGSEKMTAPDDQRDLLVTASARDRQVPTELNGILDAWALYHVRDLLAVLHENAFSRLLESLEAVNQEASGPADFNQVIQSALTDHSSQDTCLRDLGILVGDETWSTLRFRDLVHRVETATSTNFVVQNGLGKWEGGIQEHDLLRVAGAGGPGVFSILPVAWLQVIRRTEEGIRAGSEGFEALSRQPFARLGAKEILLPWKERRLQEDPLLPEVVAELIEVTVAQHLRTAWSRMALDPRKDVALLVTDGQLWQARGAYKPGRTNSRLGQATGWLAQLGLLDSGRITVTGTTVLDRALEVLAQS